MKKGWDTKELKEIIKLEYGKPLPKEKRRPNGKYPAYGANGEISRTDEYYYDKKSIIVGRKGSAGALNFTENRFWPLDVTYYVTFDDEKYDLYFIYYLLSSLEIPKFAKGVKPGINRNEVYSIEVSIPKLSEQQRIVAILEKIFEAIDKAIENAERNLENSKEVFESYLQSVFDNHGEDWEEKKLGEVCIVERGSSPRPIKKYITVHPDGVNWIKIGDTKGVDKYICSTREKITEEGAKKSRFVEEGDFILSNSMSFGKPFIMKTSGYIHDGWFVLRLPDFLDADYFYYLLGSSYVQEQFGNLASGAIVKNISGDLVKRVIIPIPPHTEQQQIVEVLKKLSKEIKTLQEIYQQKLTNLDELKKSILKKAFDGEL